MNSKKEGEYIRTNECVNKSIAGRTHDEWVDENKEKVIQYKKKYKNNNKEKIKEQNKIYREENKEQLTQKRRLKKEEVKILNK